MPKNTIREYLISFMIIPIGDDGGQVGRYPTVTADIS